MYIYKEKPNLFHSLTCEASLSYIAALILLSLIFSHPIFLLALFIPLNMVIVSARLTKEWLNYLKYSLVLIALIVLINSVFVRAGTTILFRGPSLPFLGVTRVTLEALCFSAGMGIRLLVMMGAFCLLTYGVNPDSVMKSLGGGRSKSILLVSITLRLFPLLAEDLRRVTEAQRCRGSSFHGQNVWKRVRKYVPVLNTVLLSSLERSFQLAEALQSRGYGTARRSNLTETLWRPRDYIVLATVLPAAVYGISLALSGWTGYSYYPRLQQVGSSEIALSLLLGLLFGFPALLNWGWEKWPQLRLKI